MGNMSSAVYYSSDKSLKHAIAKSGIPISNNYPNNTTAGSSSYDYWWGNSNRETAIPSTPFRPIPLTASPLLGSGTITIEKKDDYKINPFTKEELKGKLVAYVTIKSKGLEYTGVLFVRKCGAWKLVECSTMNKVLSGKQDEPLPDVKIHYIIYSHIEESSKKKSRFEDIDAVNDIDSPKE